VAAMLSHIVHWKFSRILCSAEFALLNDLTCGSHEISIHESSYTYARVCSW